MHELHRMEYLDAMGVDTFVPRFVLPAAQAPRQCELPEASESNDVPGATSLGTTSAESLVSNLLGRDIDKPATEAGNDFASASNGEPENEKSTPSASQQIADVVTEITDLKSANLSSASIGAPVEKVPEAPPVEHAKFSLNMWRIGEHVQVVDSHRVGEALPTHMLLQNILTALSEQMLRVADSQRITLPKSETLNWPLVDGDNRDQSWQAAHEMVTAFLDGKLLLHPVKTFLVFGEDAYFAIFGKCEPENWSDKCFTCIELELFESKAILLPSLADILHEPSLKRKVYHALINGL